MAVSLSDGYGTIGVVPRLGSGVPLVARDGEIAQLDAALGRAVSGQASAVLLWGDAGVGKSRVLAEFSTLAEARGALVLTGRCLGVGDAGLPYLPFTEVLDQLRRHRSDLVTWPSPTVAEHEWSQLQLFDAVLRALAEASTDRTVVVALEDLHWADASTRDLFSFLVSRLSGQRLLVVATYRADDLHRQHPLWPLLAELVRIPAVERLHLEPFPPAEAQAFVRALADDGLGDELVAAVAERSEGNAFFAEELLAAAATGEAGMPSTLAAVLLARVERLSPTAQQIVRAVSVTSRRQPRHSTLQQVLDLDEATLETALREAVQHHVLVRGDAADDTYTFRHALMREAVYNDLLPGERARLHGAYATLIGRKDDPAMAAALAYHSLHSNDLPTALAASVRAAQEAMSMGALGAGLRHLEQALELWDSVDDAEERTGVDELGLLRKAAYAASAAGQPERALAFGRAAVAVADKRDDPVLAADARRQLTEILLANVRRSEAERTIAEAWELLKHEPPSSERAWVLALLARVAKHHDSLGDPLDIAKAAIADARAAGSASAEADALITLAFYDNRAGDVERACTQLQQARHRAAEAEALDVELRAIFNEIVTRYEQGLLDVAARLVDDGARWAAEVGMTWGTYGLEIRWMQVMIHHARGDWDRAAAAAAPPGERVSDTISALIAASGGLVQVGRGEFDQAERMLAKVRPEWVRDDQIAQLAGVAGAEMACWQGRPADAARLVDEALDAIHKVSGSKWRLGGIRLATLGLAAQAELAVTARQRHDADAEEVAVTKGEQYAAHAEETARRGAPRGAELGPEGRAWLARMHAERARLAGSADPAPWRAVIEAFGYGDVYAQAIARLRLAEVLVAGGHREEAGSELAVALETAERLRARPLTAAIRDLARRARLSAVAGPSTPSTDPLTPRERSVLRLVAAGHTNRQIGEQLYISEKTVSVHLSRVMSKLGVASRTEAVAVAYQRGLLEDAEAEPASH